MNKEVIEILKGFDQLVADITTMEMKVRVGDEPFRKATPTDRIDYLRAEWFEVVETLNSLGYGI